MPDEIALDLSLKIQRDVLQLGITKEKLQEYITRGKEFYQFLKERKKADETWKETNTETKASY